jgi:prepilin-type N-terminal cleavage/methylation domain-containing protein
MSKKISSLFGKTTPRRRHPASQPGFTIVELLIVIVIIGILAAITIVAYNGIQQRAKTSAVMADLTNSAKKMAVDNTLNGSYALTAGAVDSNKGLPTSAGTTYQFHSTGSTYCITGTNGNASYKISDTATAPVAGGCAGDSQGGVAAVTNLATNPSVESNANSWAAWIPNASGSTAQVVSGGFSGNAFYRISYSTTATVNTGGIYYGNIGEMPAQPSSTYMLSGYVRVNNSRPIVASIEWYNSTPALTGSTTGTVTTVPANTWTRLSVSGGAPAGTTWARLTLYISGAAWQAGDTFDGDAVMMTSGSTAYNYADGNTSSWIWNGTTNNSTSTGPPQ